MRGNNYLYLSPSLNLSKHSSIHYQNTSKKEKYPINTYNFNYLTKLPSSYINIFCRFRPINELELLYSKKEAIKVLSSKHLILNIKNPIRITEKYTFDEIFEPNIDISTIYNKACKKIVKHSMEGFIGGIIFYGESGSGKTYTIKEIIPYIIRQIYDEIGISDYENEVFTIEIGIFEICKDQINDLLDQNNFDLNLIELKNKREIINNLTYVAINNEEELRNVINQGMNNNNQYINDKSHFIIEFKFHRYYKR